MLFFVFNAFFEAVFRIWVVARPIVVAIVVVIAALRTPITATIVVTSAVVVATLLAITAAVVVVAAAIVVVTALRTTVSALLSGLIAALWVVGIAVEARPIASLLRPSVATLHARLVAAGLHVVGIIVETRAIATLLRSSEAPATVIIVATRLRTAVTALTWLVRTLRTVAVLQCRTEAFGAEPTFVFAVVVVCSVGTLVVNARALWATAALIVVGVTSCGT